MIIRIPGEPVAQGRPRAFMLKGRGIRTFDPAKSRNWKAEARAWMCSSRGQPPGSIIIAFNDGPLTVRVLAVFTCPKGDWRKEPRDRRPHAKRPDAENVAKAVLDAGTGVLWRDDSQVARLEIEKWIGAQGEAPYVELEVNPL